MRSLKIKLYGLLVGLRLLIVGDYGYGYEFMILLLSDLGRLVIVLEVVLFYGLYYKYILVCIVLYFIYLMWVYSIKFKKVLLR